MSQGDFVTYLEGLRQDRGALAALRRGLGQPPGSATEQYRYVVPWLPKAGGRRREDAYFLIAGLFAYHPQEGGSGNVGDHMARTCQSPDDRPAVERRFTALLAAHPDDLPFYLRQAISFLRAKEVPVDWGQLLDDVLHWDHPDRYVQRRWAASFWS
ncbi:MAG: type I-E CRISPR-associated protein Cse2/CasB [Anaerolineae bacterium]